MNLYILLRCSFHHGALEHNGRHHGVFTQFFLLFVFFWFFQGFLSLTGNKTACTAIATAANDRNDQNNDKNGHQNNDTRLHFAQLHKRNLFGWRCWRDLSEGHAFILKKLVRLANLGQAKFPNSCNRLLHGWMIETGIGTESFFSINGLDRKGESENKQRKSKGAWLTDNFHINFCNLILIDYLDINGFCSAIMIWS